jgi:hypothetical protein
LDTNKDITPVPKLITNSLFIGNPVVIDGLLVTDYLASQNLNECVDALLSNSEPSDHQTKRNPAYHYRANKPPI